MTHQVRRPEDAENESPKKSAIVVRMGENTKALIDRAAHHRGMDSGAYVRRAATTAALEDLADVPAAAEPAADDAKPVAHNG